MKLKALMIAGLAGLLTIPALAGDGARGKDARAQMLGEQLGLDSVQTEQVVMILDEQREKYRALHQELRSQGVERGSDEARALRDQAREETHARLATILTPEQIETFEELRQSRRGKGRGKRQYSESM